MSVEARGAIKVFKEVHPLKAPALMVATESGMMMLVNELHPSKALYPMIVTESGMMMLANELQPSKAWVPTVVHLDESTTVVIENSIEDNASITSV